MKKLLSLLFLAACSTPNPAEIMVKAQVPEAKCVNYGTRDGVSITRCTIKGEKDSFQVIAGYSVAHPFQTCPLKTTEQLKQEAARNNPPAPTPAPEATGSGSATK